MAAPPEFGETSRLLGTIPGVDLCTIAILCATVDAGDFPNPRKLAAFASLTPGRQ